MPRAQRRTSDSDRSERWNRLSQWPLAAAALIFLACYSWLILQPGMPHSRAVVLGVIDYVTWGMFLVDYLVRLSLARRKAHWFFHNIAELLVVALPVLRPLRLLRLASLLRILERVTTTSVRGRIGLYVAVTSCLTVYGGALAVLSAERGHPGANIETFGTALWWTMSTVTTVGYGDYYPVTTEGRFVAAALMIAGVALISTVTASVASYLVDRVRRSSHRAPAPEPATANDVTSLHLEIAELKQLLQANRSGQRNGV